MFGVRQVRIEPVREKALIKDYKNKRFDEALIMTLRWWLNLYNIYVHIYSYIFKKMEFKKSKSVGLEVCYKKYKGIKLEHSSHPIERCGPFCVGYPTVGQIITSFWNSHWKLFDGLVNVQEIVIVNQITY